MTEQAERRRWPKRTIRVELDGDYEGFWCVWWRNAPVAWDVRWKLAVRQFDVAGQVRAIWACLLDHNFTDYDGNPLPPGGSELSNEDLERIPADLPDAIVLAVQRAIRDDGAQNPNG